MATDNNCILVVGPTGVGKSFLCNKIFETCGNHSTSFLSSSSILSTTKETQSGAVNYCDKTYTLMDFPGIYDVSSGSTNKSQAEVDAENTCKLIKSFQSCGSISAIIFCYTGPRFPLHLKIWYDRIRGIIAGHPNLNILLLENQCTNIDDDPGLQMKRNLELHQILGLPPNAPTVPYIRFKRYTNGMDAGNDVQNVLNKIHTWTPVTVTAPIVPDMCYRGTIEGPLFEEVISQTKKDEGHMVTTSRQEPYYEERMVHDGDLGKIFGWKVKKREWKQRTVTEQVWSPKIVTYTVVAQFRNIFKVRYDGTQDFDKKVEVKRRTDKT